MIIKIYKGIEHLNPHNLISENLRQKTSKCHKNTSYLSNLLQSQQCNKNGKKDTSL